MTTANGDAARHAALSALQAFAARQAAAPAERAALVAAAWRAGLHNVAELADAAGVTRPPIYSDLRSQGIDPRTDRTTSPLIIRTRGVVECAITTFGYADEAATQRASDAHLIVDVRNGIPPLTDMDELTGLDTAVRYRVLATEGVHGWLDDLAKATDTMLRLSAPSRRLVTIALGDDTGQRRAVAVASILAAALTSRGWGVETEHLNLDDPS